MNVRTTLQTREHTIVDLILELLLEEDDAGAGATETLVSGGGHNISILEGVVGHLGGHKSRDVSHVHEQKSTTAIGYLTETGIVPLTRVSRASHDEHGGLKQVSLGSKSVIVDETSLRVDTVGKTLEVDGSGTHSLAAIVRLRVGVEAVGQMSTRR